jgi:hypothetical protein
LILQSFMEQDSEALHRIMNEEGMLRFFPNTKPPVREQVERPIGRQLQHWEEHAYGWWTVELREAPGLIGWHGLQHQPETDEVEAGDLLSCIEWGQDLAAAVSKTGAVGTYGGVNFEGVMDLMDGFVPGVAHYNRRHGAGVHVLGRDVATRDGLFTRTFVDPEGRRMGELLLDQGADVILPVAGETGLGTAAAVAAQRGPMSSVWTPIGRSPVRSMCPSF